MSDEVFHIIIALLTGNTPTNEDRKRNGRQLLPPVKEESAFRCLQG
jgi:hypothetical protein